MKPFLNCLPFLLTVAYCAVGCKAKTTTAPAAVTSNIHSEIIHDTSRSTKVFSAVQLADSLIKDYAASEHLPGLAAGIMVDGKLVHTLYYGFQDLRTKTPVDSLSAFRIASMTKSLTAMAILKLRDEGKLQLDMPASTYIPEMGSIKYLTTDVPAITVRDLLTHRAGFPEDNPYGDRQLADSETDLINAIKSGPAFSNVPGIAYEYSNLGFALLGKIIANVSGATYKQYVTDNILRPLGMTHSYFEYTEVTPAHLAHGYRWINNDWRDELLLKHGSWGSMGGLITTIEDFSKYMAFHLSAWPPKNGPETGPIKRSSVREMQQSWNFAKLSADYSYATGRPCATTYAYGYGLGILTDCEGRRFIGHGGGLPGFGSYWRIMPEYSVSIAIFSNRTYAPISSLSLNVLDTIIALSKLQTIRQQPSSILEQRKNELLTFLPSWKNATTSKIFAENFFLDYPVESLEIEATKLFSKAGKINSVSNVIPLNQLRGSFTINCERANILISFTLTPEHNPTIQEYHITVLTNRD